jgi:hypothetical protein
LRGCGAAPASSGRAPSPERYTDWRRALIATPGNGAVRVPTVKSIVEHAGDGSWRAAAARAAIDPTELARSRAAHLPQVEPAPATVADRLDALDESQLATLGLTRTHARLLRGPKPRAALALSAAVPVARTLGGSLDWLADLSDEPGIPPDGERAFDSAQVKALREHHGISEKLLREGAGLTLGDWRRLMAGSREPTLGQLKALARSLRTSIAAITVPA